MRAIICKLFLSRTRSKTVDAIQDEAHVERSLKRRWVYRGLWLIVSLVAFAILLVAAAYYAIQCSPKFYQSTLKMSDDEAFAAGVDFETSALYLRNDMVTREAWSAWFSEGQINGWLVNDLVRKFPNLLPAEVSDPRVTLLDDRAIIACRYQSGNLNAILVAELDVFLTDVPDQVGVTVYATRAGWIPIPVSLWHESISDALQGKGLKLSWTEDPNGNPVGLLDISERKLTFEGQRICLDQISISDQILELAGHSTPMDSGEASGLETEND